MDVLNRVRKALVAGVAAGAAAYTTAVADNVVNQTDWALIVGTVIVTAVLTWAVPNKPKPTSEA